jgi:hypothetical protein
MGTAGVSINEVTGSTAVNFAMLIQSVKRSLARLVSSFGCLPPLFTILVLNCAFSVDILAQQSNVFLDKLPVLSAYHAGILF